MDEKLYTLMNWPEIEAIVYSEHDIPQQVLGQKVTDDGILIQGFLPDAVSMEVHVDTNKKIYPMERVDEAGFFAVLIPGKRKLKYHFHAVFEDETTYDYQDPYAFDPLIRQSDLDKFSEGIHYEIYKLLGSHVTTIDGVKGVHFAVWAPHAIRVSVVGDFNHWDGRVHPMRRLSRESGIHELFIPGLLSGENYKYEIKVKGDTVVLKSDPYGQYAQMRPENASVTYESTYQWKDDQWMAEAKKKKTEEEPMLVYEVHLAGFMKPTDGRNFYNYRELAPLLADYVKKMGYTHVELMPVMEHPLDESWGYQVTGYYAPTSRYGTPDDFKYFMDYMHEKGIGVILDWVPAHFPKDLVGLARFDGSCLYEHKDPRQGEHPHWGTLIFNYGSPQVSNFLIANALYWVEEYHADGIRMDAVASMLYLDYGKNDGEWVANMYGGNENLEAIEFLKHLNSVMHKRNKNALVIAEESTAWPKITHPLDEEGLGFDLKWNMGWMNDFLGFMQQDPLFRSGHYGELLFSLVYAYSENFILVLSHDEVVHMKGSMLGKMPGTDEQKFANLRVAYGFMAAHPGKKLLFMGQEFGQVEEFNEAKSLTWEALEQKEHQQMQDYVKDLNALYKKYPAFYQDDFLPEGFEWINNISAEETMVVFLRKTQKEEETLLFVCNFTPVLRPEHKIGVPFNGKYKEIFNSDQEKYGGEGNVNPRVISSKKSECDGREDSIYVTVPPLGFSVFTCTRVKETVKKAPAKKTAAKKEPVKKIATKKPAVQEKIATKKPVKQEKIETKKPVKQEKIETKKPVKQEKIETKKPARQEKIETKKPAVQSKITTKKPAVQKKIEKKEQ